MIQIYFKALCWTEDVLNLVKNNKIRYRNSFSNFIKNAVSKTVIE